MARSSRRTWLLAWLPAMVLVIVIAGVVFTTIAVQNSWWAEEKPEASSEQKASDGSTMLTDAGFDYANVEGVVRVRMGAGGPSATDLGLPATGQKDAEFRRPVRTVVAAGDDVFVVDDVATLSASSRNDELTSVSIRLDRVSTWQNALTALRSMADGLGWNPAEIDALDDGLAEFNRDSDGDTFTAVITAQHDEVTVTATLVFDRASGATPVLITFALRE
ncbi:hypothetical protein AB1K54_14065 [Microbacterium sp. BWT-B31]|uniref:hypothetical protein n=1 Tax=Microbacterium sp. BWT-B31 TaxID=3232072 RepID=UPI0035287375